MPENGRRERDLILAPNEYAFILDETKGNIVNYVGPHKTSLANTDQPVIFNSRNKRFERCMLEQAIQLFAIAPEGWYTVLKNPARDGKPPTPGTANSLPGLDIGRKVNIPGPVAFAPWPGQMVRVMQGHHLRSNQYLIVRVYDEEAARENWGKAVIKPQTGTTGDSIESEGGETKADVEVKPDVEVPDLTMGKLLVIKGTDVSFYIPPSGIEVVPDRKGRLGEILVKAGVISKEQLKEGLLLQKENNKLLGRILIEQGWATEQEVYRGVTEILHYVRDAVTLERLEYCILLDEDGNKRFITGPAVVFPNPTETFITKDSSRKFRAIELNEISGLYIKVIASYNEGKQEFKVGEELFITGKEQMIYFPRPEHAIIRYGEREVHYAVAIPAGEARYVLNRVTGQITLERGPCMFLADPRKEVIVRRVLDPRLVAVWFPGNQEALEYNRRLMALTRKEQGEQFVRERELQQAFALEELEEVEEIGEFEAVEEFVGEEFTRRQQFTPPRTITLDTKYEGAVAINVWTGYASLVVGKTGERKVIVGPKTYLLEYDEILETVELSTGTPKTDAKLVKTVYLRVLHNKVSDIVEAETQDLCPVRLHVSYRVNFEGEPEQWFNVENYVKFLTDHMRSLLRNAVKHHGIEEFYANAIQIIRDTILGTPDEKNQRPGRMFNENGMRIYDVEVLDVRIDDGTIAQLLVAAQHSAVQQTLQIAAEQRRLEFTQQKETISQGISKAEAATQQLTLDLEIEEVKKRLDLNLAKIESEVEGQKKELEAKLAQQASLDKVHAAELGRQKAKTDLALAITQQELTQHIEELKADVEAVVNKANAVSPQLVAALQAFSDRSLAERMARSMAPLAILGGKSVADVFGQLLKGTVLEEVLIPQPEQKPASKSKGAKKS
jgi:major vault protein